jgi:putative adhesin
MSPRQSFGLCWLLAAALPVLPSSRLPAQGKPDFEFRRELAPGKRFYLSDIIGDVRVTGGPGRTVEVTAIKRERQHGDPEDVTIETIELDDGVALCVRYPSSRGGRPPSEKARAKNPCSWEGRWTGNDHERNDTEVEFTVRVPAGLRLHIGTVSGDVFAERLEGELDLHSVSGDVRLQGGRGESINLETVSGDVDLLDVTSKEVSGHTISGEIVFKGPIQDGGSYDFSTTSGDITAQLPLRPSATLSAATFSGGFSSDLPVNQDTSRRRRHRYDGTWGSGSAKLYMESLSGDLSIRVTGR